MKAAHARRVALTGGALAQGALVGLLVVLLLGCEPSAAPTGAPSSSRSEAVLTSDRSKSTPGSGSAAPSSPAAGSVPQGDHPAPPGSQGLDCRSASGMLPETALDVRGARSTARARRHLFQGRPVFVNLWAAWCEPCKEEIPLLLEVAERLRSRGVEADLAFVSLDDDERQLARFLDLPGSPEETFFLPEGDSRRKFLSALGLPEAPRLPMQALFDRTGRLRCIIDGAVSRSDLPALERLVVEL